MARYLLILLLICNTALANNEAEAVKQASTAAYKQLGIEVNIQKMIENTVPKNIQQIATYIGPIIDAAINQRLELKWNF